MRMSLIAHDADGVPDPGAIGAHGCGCLCGLNGVCVTPSKLALISSCALEEEGIVGNAVGKINQTRKALYVQSC